MGLLSTLGLIAAGYAMLFVQFWLRAWKCHYANLCHALWREHPASFGDKVPVWMRGGVRFVSADLLYRTLPFGVNGLLLATLALDLQNRFGWGLGTAGALAGALLAAHLGVSYALSRSAADLERFSL
jgi:hypothetical protein